MDSTLKDGLSPPLIFEEIADSELCASGAVMLSSGAKEEEDDDDDAESCNCDAYGSGPRGYDSGVDDGAGRGEEAACKDGPPVSWWAWLAQNAACGTEEAGRGEEEEVASAKPVALMEDRLFWETCLAYGYP